MRNRFNYAYESTSNSDIQIDDIGNVALEGINLQGQKFILYIKTILGFTYILEYGPYCNDERLINFCKSQFQKIEYSEYKINKIIDKFINNPRYMIYQVEEIEEQEARDNIRPILEVFDESCQ